MRKAVLYDTLKMAALHVSSCNLYVVCPGIQFLKYVAVLRENRYSWF